MNFPRKCRLCRRTVLVTEQDVSPMTRHMLLFHPGFHVESINTSELNEERGTNDLDEFTRVYLNNTLSAVSTSSEESAYFSQTCITNQLETERPSTNSNRGDVRVLKPINAVYITDSRQLYLEQNRVPLRTKEENVVPEQTTVKTSWKDNRNKDNAAPVQKSTKGKSPYVHVFGIDNCASATNYKPFKVVIEKWRTGIGTKMCPKCGSNKKPIIRTYTIKTPNSLIGSIIMWFCSPVCYLPYFFGSKVISNAHCSVCNYCLGTCDPTTGVIQLKSKTVRKQVSSEQSNNATKN